MGGQGAPQGSALQKDAPHIVVGDVRIVGDHAQPPDGDSLYAEHAGQGQFFPHALGVLVPQAVVFPVGGII